MGSTIDYPSAGITATPVFHFSSRGERSYRSWPNNPGFTSPIRNPPFCHHERFLRLLIACSRSGKPLTRRDVGWDRANGKSRPRKKSLLTRLALFVHTAYLESVVNRQSSTLLTSGTRFASNSGNARASALQASASLLRSLPRSVRRGGKVWPHYFVYRFLGLAGSSPSLMTSSLCRSNKSRHVSRCALR